MMNERLRVALVALLAVATVGACEEAPVDVAADEAVRLFSNPGSVAVDAGDTTTVDAYLQTALNHPLSGEVTYTICDASVATVVDIEDKTDLEPGTRFGVVGQTIGSTCVVISAGGFQDTIPVRVVAAGFDVSGVPETIRAGATGDIGVQAINAQGAAVGPFAETNVTFSSNNEDALFFTSDTGAFDTEEAGNVTVTMSWTTQGITRTETASIQVLPAEPDAATVSPADFGAAGVGDSTMVNVIVVDSLGNQNRLPSDLTSITATSDDPAVATVNARFEDDPSAPGEIDAVVWATGVSVGVTTIDITIGTVSGDFTINDVPVTVVSPNVTAVTPASGNPGQTVVISGTALTAAGFDTEVFLDGTDITSYVTATTAVAITLDIPAHPANGDHELVVAVGGVESNAGPWEQLSTSDVYSPGNESPATAPGVTFPVNIVGTFQGANDYDWYELTLAAPATVSFTLDWEGGKDLDFLIRNAANTGYVCSTAGASANHPENAGCDMPAGTYLLLVNDYSNSANGDTGLVTYELTGTATP